MNHETKIKILNMLHQLPLNAIKAQASKYQNTQDATFWESLYELEKRQRS